MAANEGLYQTDDRKHTHDNEERFQNPGHLFLLALVRVFLYRRDLLGSDPAASDFFVCTGVTWPSRIITVLIFEFLLVIHALNPSNKTSQLPHHTEHQAAVPIQLLSADSLQSQREDIRKGLPFAEAKEEA
ncbi:hypothetical protein HMPREF0308_1058 [Corynebacterium striatum ATCC 6940]|nr:hypothetical protein HMPREF0308_1058 [Corynebacterium striatum ATCC 6940]